MSATIQTVVSIVTDQMQTMGPLIGIILIILESIIPVLPLSVFIALNTISYGTIFGFIVSWLATCIGCSVSFFICRKKFSSKLYNKLNKKKNSKLNNIMKSINKISFSSLVIITAIPFSPAFLINVACGLSSITYRKFILAILIAKIVIVYFWGYIGKSFVESITNPEILIKILIMLLSTYLISLIIKKKFKVE